MKTKLQNKELIKITDENIPSFVLTSSISLVWMYQISLRSKIVYYSGLKGRGTSHHSPVLKTRRHHLEYLLEKWFVSRAPH